MCQLLKSFVICQQKFTSPYVAVTAISCAVKGDTDNGSIYRVINHTTDDMRHDGAVPGLIVDHLFWEARSVAYRVEA